ncbi:MAG: hypothetical protein RLZZ414_562 [Bacteroidota bacterium]|jgi:hypothetical protein
MFKKLFLKINPVEVIKALKKTDTKVKVEGITQMGGGGVLMSSGVALITDGAINQNWFEIVGGAVILIVGVYVAKNLTDKIEKIKDNEESC